MENSTPKCFCSQDVFQDDRCILHCEKSDWFDIDEKGEQDWSRSNEKLVLFWKVFNEVKDNMSEIEGFIFPKPLADNCNVLVYDTQYAKKIYFLNCIFCSYVKFDRVVTSHKKKFKNCVFNAGLEVSDCNLWERSEQEIGCIDFSNSIVKDTLIIEKMNIARLILANLDITNAETIELKDNSYDDAKFKNIHWGDKSRIKADRDEFRQLKFAYDKQANYIEANEFYALEMREREKELARQKCSEDWWVFKIGGWVSKHSQSWWRPFWLMCLVSLPFLLIFGVKFINPFSTKYDGDGLGWWIFYKSIFAFLLYHFIVSLRRNTKR